MLKIKDGIDLKELEKYDFEYNKKENYYEYGYDKYDVTIYLYANERILKCSIPVSYNLDDSDSHLDVLYDLIQDGLVEKVGDN